MIQQKFIGIAIVVLGVAGGTIFIIHDRTQGPRAGATITAIVPSTPVTSIPTPAWYEAHPDVLKADNSRCAAEGKNMPPGLCENVGIADKSVSDNNFMNALNQAGAPGK
jgi:hypothetical protein